MTILEQFFPFLYFSDCWSDHFLLYCHAVSAELMNTADGSTNWKKKANENNLFIIKVEILDSLFFLFILFIEKHASAHLVEAKKQKICKYKYEKQAQN